MQERKQRNVPIERNGKLYFVCKKCKTEKELTNEFWRKEARVKMGFTSTCKDCLKKKDSRYREKYKEAIRERGRIFAKKYRIKNKEKIRAYSIWYSDTHKEQIREKSKKYREENAEILREKRRMARPKQKEKRRLRFEKNKEVILLKRWQRVEKMGYKNIHQRVNYIINKECIRPQKCSICGYEGQIVAHHPDYSKEYEIVFCCQSCHKLIHLGKIGVSKEFIINLKHKK